MDPQMVEAFRLIPYGIYVLTTKRGTRPHDDRLLGLPGFFLPSPSGCRPSPESQSPASRSGKWFFFSQLVEKGPEAPGLPA